MTVHPVRLRKRLDPQSLVAAERHPATGRLTPHGRRNKARNAPKASLARTGGVAGLIAAGALVTAAAGGAAAAMKSGSSNDRPHPAPVPLAQQSTAPSSAPSKAASKSLPAPCRLVSQAAAQQAIGAPVETSENTPTSCLYVGTAPAPFRSVEIRYEPHFDPDHVRRTLSAAHVAATPIDGLGPGAFAHPAFERTANGTTQVLPAEAVVPVGSTTVIISTLTLNEGSADALVDAAHDAAVAVAVARAVLTPYAGQ